jgi:hypothetical protein
LPLRVVTRRKPKNPKSWEVSRNSVTSRRTRRIINYVHLQFFAGLALGMLLITTLQAAVNYCIFFQFRMCWLHYGVLIMLLCVHS